MRRKAYGIQSIFESLLLTACKNHHFTQTNSMRTRRKLLKRFKNCLSSLLKEDFGKASLISNFGLEVLPEEEADHKMHVTQLETRARHLRPAFVYTRIRFQIVPFSYRCVFKWIHFGLRIQMFKQLRFYDRLHRLRRV